MRRIAGVDCGTNSIRVLIADVGTDGRLVDVARKMRVVRLGEGVDRTGRFTSEAIERTQVALREYVTLMKSLAVSEVRMVATSATRDAANRDEFFEMTAELLGQVAPGTVAEVITGDEEARLSFAGAVGELDMAAGSCVVTDLGGGSTEVVVGDETGVLAAYSADIGCVRLTERALATDPPTAREIAHARDMAAHLLAEAFAAVPVSDVGTWVGVAGTMTTLSAVAQGLADYDPDRIHMSRIGLSALDDTCERLIHMTRAERAEVGPMHPGRVDVIGGGAIVCQGLARVIGASVSELVVSEHDILDGIVMSLL